MLHFACTSPHVDLRDHRCIFPDLQALLANAQLEAANDALAADSTRASSYNQGDSASATPAQWLLRPWDYPWIDERVAMPLIAPARTSVDQPDSHPIASEDVLGTKDHCQVGVMRNAGSAEHSSHAPSQSKPRKQQASTIGTTRSSDMRIATRHLEAALAATSPSVPPSDMRSGSLTFAQFGNEASVGDDHFAYERAHFGSRVSHA